MNRKLPLFFCDHYPLPLPPGHKFPLVKYGAVRQLLHGDARLSFFEAPLVTDEDVLRVHGPEYLAKFLDGTLPPSVIRRIGFPWSTGLVQRTLASAGGTLAAAQQALETGLAGSVAGGTHHAFPDEGAGFCVFNDIAIAVEWARQCRGLSRVAVIDLDVHQGDGTASIFQDDPGVYTLSFHGARNFPFRKQRSRVDVEFANGATGSDYLPLLVNALSDVWAFRPELVLYQAGVDALASDRLGLLALTLEDLATRDRLVFGAAMERHVPLAFTMGGGYSEPIELTIEAHAQTYRVAAEVLFRAAAS